MIHNLWFVEIAIGQLGPIWTRRLPDMLVITNMTAAVFTVAVHPRSGVLLRRIFVILAYLFFLRSVCVISTSLPDMSDHCQVCVSLTLLDVRVTAASHCYTA